MKSLPLAVTLGLFTLSLSAQIQNARVEGNVVDSSRAVIVGAKLVITNNKTQVKTEAETDAAGFFTFPVVPPGFYSLSAEAKGFRKGEITSCTTEEFRPVFERFCERYNAHPSHSMGSFPFEGTWDFKNGWQKR